MCVCVCVRASLRGLDSCLDFLVSRLSLDLYWFLPGLTPVGATVMWTASWLLNLCTVAFWTDRCVPIRFLMDAHCVTAGGAQFPVSSPDLLLLGGFNRWRGERCRQLRYSNTGMFYTTNPRNPSEPVHAVRFCFFSYEPCPESNPCFGSLLFLSRSSSSGRSEEDLTDSDRL